MPQRERRSLVKHLRVVAGAVDDDVEALLHEVLGELPLEAVGLPGGVVEGDDAGFEEAGAEDVVVDDDGMDAGAEESCDAAFAGAGGSRHLDEELGHLVCGGRCAVFLDIDIWKWRWVVSRLPAVCLRVRHFEGDEELTSMR